MIHMTRVRSGVYMHIDFQLKRSVKMLAASSGVTIGSIAEAALRHYLVEEANFCPECGYSGGLGLCCGCPKCGYTLES